MLTGPGTGRPTPSSHPQGTSLEEVLGRTPDYEVVAHKHNGWFVVTVRGRYLDPMIEVLRTRVFKESKLSLAIDLSKLANVGMPLAREIYFFSQQLRQQGDRRVVLLNPPEKMRSLLGLISPSAKMITFSTENELPADVRTLENMAERMETECVAIRKSITTNALWQFVDRESSWLCPFCAQIIEDVKVVSRVSIPQAVVEKVYRHIHHGCSVYNPVTPQYQPVEALEKKIHAVNEQKFRASSAHAEKLESTVKQLQDKAQFAESMEQGLRVAVDRQRRLLPARPPEVQGCEIALVYRPAQRVSGDFYDFMELPDGRMGISIGDVAGHGIEAGILMGMTKKVINIRALDLGDPVAAMRKANADIYKELDRQTFVTAFLAFYDPQTRLLSYARAGHNPPLLFNKKREPRHRKFDASGLMLGMSLGAVFDRAIRGENVQLESGDVLFFFTDGLEEAKNEKQQLFGLDRVTPILESEVDRPASFILGAVSFALDRFCGQCPQEDDITAICVKIL
ncbi:MAG: PP2C family protein-serine/threonine phosphatase [Planctomycetes bacterium]|nr:PP2C family protein-serine/threonine phosphatase [Planctomycetota bacterium]